MDGRVEPEVLVIGGGGDRGGVFISLNRVSVLDSPFGTFKLPQKHS